MDLVTIDRFFYQKVAEKLNDIRLRQRKTYRELSEATGLSVSALDCFFLGRVRAKDRKFKLICDALEINPKDVINVILNT